MVLEDFTASLSRFGHATTTFMEFQGCVQYMTKLVPAAGLVAALLLAMVPAASAHGAAPALPYLTRLLSDHSDDWLGVQDGHNLIALDAYATYNETLGGNTLVLRIIMDGGYAQANSAHPDLAEHVMFKVKGKDQNLAVHTEDNAKFEVEDGFQAVRGPYPQLKADGTPDGSRFFVEGLIAYRALGADVGDAATDWFVQGEAGDGDGDAMVQGYAPGYDEPACTVGGPVAGQCVAFNIGTYNLRAPDYYATLDVPSMLDLKAVTDTPFEVTVQNKVNATAQTVTLSSVAPTGMFVDFQQGDKTLPTASVDLPAGGKATIKATLHSKNASPGTFSLPIQVATNLGGRTLGSIQVMVPKPAGNDGMGMGGNATTPPPSTHPATGTPTTPPTSGTPATTTSKGSPGAPVWGTLALVAIAAYAARRRFQ